MFYHTTKDGQKIPLKYIEDNHLLNILKWIKRRAKEGVRIRYGRGIEPNSGEVYYDEETLFDRDALEHLNYKEYRREAKKRGLI